MNPKKALFSTVAAIGIFTLASSVPVPLNAQPKPPQGVATAVAIDAEMIDRATRVRTPGTMCAASVLK